MVSEYIDYNREKSKAANQFEQDFYKGQVACFFGKTMEDVRKMPKVESVRKDDEKILMNKQSKLSFIGVH